MTNLPYLLALHTVEGLGPIRLKKVIEYFKDPKIAWEAPLNEFRNLGISEGVLSKLDEARKKLDPNKYFGQIEESGIKVVTIFDEDYPELLKEIYDPPIILYYKGDLAASRNKCLAIVGTRKVTSYGRLVTEKFAGELSKLHFCIVSGLARGVDTVAHKTTLQNSGITIAVLGGGLNEIFPPENNSLVLEIVKSSGLVLTEFPPDYSSLPGNFPARNRIIAGLSIGVLVTEAAEDSGSLITARAALEYGRSVFAVPGPITSNLAKGPYDLIKNGAKITTSVEDILEELGFEAKLATPPVQVKKLSSLEEEILECLNGESKHIDEVCRELQNSSANISASLIKMEIWGLVKNMGGGTYIKIS